MSESVLGTPQTLSAKMFSRYSWLSHNCRSACYGPTEESVAPQAINSEKGVEARVSELVFPVVSRALRATYLQTTQTAAQRVKMDVGPIGKTPGGLTPDWGIFRAATMPKAANIAPGELKPSHNSQSDFQAGLPPQEDAYAATVSQLNSYMNLHDAQYGWILTDQEMLVCRRKRDDPETSDVCTNPMVSLSHIPGASFDSPTRLVGYCHASSSHLDYL